jgi:hypothetical protein
LEINKLARNQMLFIKALVFCGIFPKMSKQALYAVLAVSATQRCGRTIYCAEVLVCQKAPSVLNNMNY